MTTIIASVRAQPKIENQIKSKFTFNDDCLIINIADKNYIIRPTNNTVQYLNTNNEKYINITFELFCSLVKHFLKDSPIDVNIEFNDDQLEMTLTLVSTIRTNIIFLFDRFRQLPNPLAGLVKIYGAPVAVSKIESKYIPSRVCANIVN